MTSISKLIKVSEKNSTSINFYEIIHLALTIIFTVLKFCSNVLSRKVLQIAFVLYDAPYNSNFRVKTEPMRKTFSVFGFNFYNC